MKERIFKSLFEILGITWLSSIFSMEMLEEIITAILIVVINCLLLPLIKKSVKKIKEKLHKEFPEDTEEIDKSINELEEKIKEDINKIKEELKEYDKKR